MNELMSILQDLCPNVDFEHHEHLIDDAVLDSLAIVSLITEIDEAFDVTITAKDIVPENFNSAHAMWAMIQRLEEE